MPRWRKRNLAVCCLTGLTHADGCDDRGGDDGQGHTARDGEVPLVARRLLQLVVGVDLQQREQHGSSSFMHCNLFFSHYFMGYQTFFFRSNSSLEYFYGVIQTLLVTARD